jgi:hypothetical protein
VSVHERGNQSAIAESQFAIAEFQFATAESQSAIAEFKSSKASPDQVSDNSPYSYQIFNNSLSDSEREKFLEFGLNKAAALPKPPTLPEKWIEKHHQELYEQFKRSPEGKTVTSALDWENHPKRDEWIAEIRIGRPRFVALGGPETERETRRQFAQWAEDNNLVWGVES